jgi:branched-chain amino acid transport system permease protein
MSTLAAQYIITFVIVRWKSVTGGAIGYNAAVPNLFGIAFDTNQKFFYIAFVVMIIMTFIAKNLVRTQVGRAWVAIRDNEIAAEAQGINLAKYKITAFFIGCFFAGIAGSLWAHWLRVVSIDQFNILQSINYLVYVIIGGIATMIGPFIGVVFMTLLSEGLGLILGAASDVFPAVSSYIFASREVLFGIVIVIFLIFQPRGLAYRWSWLKTYFRTWPFGH